MIILARYWNPLKQIKLNRVFQILYPLLVYFFIYQLGVAFLIDIIGDKYGKLTCLLIAGIVCIIPIFQIYSSVPKLIPEQTISRKLIIQYILWVVGAVLLGIVVNIILTHTPLIEASAGFSKSSSILTDGNLLIKILCNCLVIPILEELLMRGIIVGQIYLWHGTLPAIIISSICFGILHNNIVQFIYAMVIGIGLGLMYIKTRRLSLSILTHCLINFIVIIFS